MQSADFAGGAHLVETSPKLREKQADSVPRAQFHDRVEQLPGVPLLLAANEFLDALPARQWIGNEERKVMIENDRLTFTRDGEIHEDSPYRHEAVSGIARHLVGNGGVALIIDYGHARTAPGDTLQAVRDHHYADPLDHPGEQDLTSHVDFEALGRAAEQAGALVSGPVTQGEWLRRLGIEHRAQSLIATNPDKRHDVEQALHRLCGRDEMGELFKVMAIRSPDWPEPAGFAA
jgi:SAM-dependent MidA family methyltransferase